MIIGTAGHVDHGKTSLIKALTQVDCDTHKAEKERGITINLGFSHIELSNQLSAGIIDVPGHKDFIDTMVSGACSFDMVMMVIAADSGIMPQTMEHLNIISMLGVQSGVIVITRIDLVDQDFLELVELEIMEKFAASGLTNSPVIPVSSITGEGIDRLKSTLVDCSKNIVPRPTNKMFRMYIDRLFNVKGLGYVATGSALSGRLAKSNDIYLLPPGKSLKVRGIQRHSTDVERVSAGDRAAINLAGLKADEFERGMLLCSELLEPISMLDARIKLFEISSELKRWSTVMLHSGTYHSQVKIQLLNKNLLKEGEEAIVQIQLEKPAVFLPKDRFILRNSSGDITLGGGEVFDVKPLHHRKRTSALIKRLEELSNAILNESSLGPVLLAELKKHQTPVALNELALQLQIPENDLKLLSEELNGQGLSYFNADSTSIIVDQDILNQHSNLIVENIKDWHKRYFLFDSGLTTAELFGKTGLVKNELHLKYLELVLKYLKNEEKLLAFNKGTWILLNHEVKIDRKTQEHIEWLLGCLKAFGSQKPVFSEIETSAREVKINKDRLNMLLKYLVAQKAIYLIDGDVLHADIVNRARKKLLGELLRLNKGINEGDFRILIDGTKKIVHPLLAIFKKEGVVVQEKYMINITVKGRAAT